MFQIRHEQHIFFFFLGAGDIGWEETQNQGTPLAVIALASHSVGALRGVMNTYLLFPMRELSTSWASLLALNTIWSKGRDKIPPFSILCGFTWQRSCITHFFNVCRPCAQPSFSRLLQHSRSSNWAFSSLNGSPGPDHYTGWWIWCIHIAKRNKKIIQRWLVWSSKVKLQAWNRCTD